jgi:hypothetical protein
MRHQAIAFASLLLIVAAAAPATAVRDDQSYENQRAGTSNPRCTGGAEASSVTADTSPAREATGGEDSPVPRERAKVPLGLEIGGETVFKHCTGEHWDGQDPNTRNSESDTTASEDGDVYVNPLGDCSRYDGDSASEGCEGGTDRPDGPTDPIHLRATASVDSTATGDDTNRVVVYVNEEIWGVGTLSPAVAYDQSREGGYVALYGEDHTDQLFYGGDDGQGGENAGFIGQFTGPLPILETFDGNVVCIPFDGIQSGNCGEGDCTQARYQSDRDCTRDNTVLSTVEFGHGWAPVP